MPSLHSIQAPGAVVMIRPHAFTPNPETAADNAHDEVTQAAWRLEQEGVRVHLFEDHGGRGTPDSVFPNNWFSTHPGGHVAIYPMRSPSHRRERRADVIELLKAEYRVQDVIDYSGLEPDGLFLEGTGAMVLDHLERVAYTARSNRADPVALERFSTHFHFEPMVFDTADAAGQPIYHTNVLMCVATAFAMVGFEMIPNHGRAAQVRSRLEESGRDVIALSSAQISEFAGNAIELSGRDGRILAISQRAVDSLDTAQQALIGRSCRIVPLAVPTVEMAGGSVRMHAGRHLSLPPNGVFGRIALAQGRNGRHRLQRSTRPVTCAADAQRQAFDEPDRPSDAILAMMERSKWPGPCLPAIASSTRCASSFSKGSMHDSAPLRLHRDCRHPLPVASSRRKVGRAHRSRMLRESPCSGLFYPSNIVFPKYSG